MEAFVRRTNLLLAVTSEKVVETAGQYNGDAITLDLRSLNQGNKDDAQRLSAREFVALAGRGGEEVFVRVDLDAMYGLLEACVYPGLKGVVLSEASSGENVKEVELYLEDLERHRGLKIGAVEIVPVCQSGMAVWGVRGIVTASSRVRQVILDEPGLAADLGVQASQDIDPLAYARGRIVIEARAARVQPVLGIGLHILRPQAADSQAIYEQASKAYQLGFKGAFCLHHNWIEPCSRAFTPSSDRVEYSQEVRKVFAEGVAAGRGAVALRGRMIERPVDDRARDVLAWAEMCTKREAEKTSARQAAATRGAKSA